MIQSALIQRRNEEGAQLVMHVCEYGSHPYGSPLEMLWRTIIIENISKGDVLTFHHWHELPSSGCRSRGGMRRRTEHSERDEEEKRKYCTGAFQSPIQTSRFGVRAEIHDCTVSISSRVFSKSMFLFMLDVVYRFSFR